MEAKRILAIEDEQDLLDLYGYLFETAGYEVTTSLTGEFMVQQIQAFGPDLVLLDVNLGGLNGSRLCREIKSDPAMDHIVVILVSGESNKYELLSESGSDAFIAKPFDMDHLLHKVQQLIAA